MTNKFTPTKSDEIADKVQGKGGFVTFNEDDDRENVLAVLLKGLPEINLFQVTLNIVFNKKTGKGWIEAFKKDDD